MKEQIHLPASHYSYQIHRREFWIQIFLPVILAVLLIIAAAILISISAFGANGDSSRWAAISAIWLLIPTMFFGLLFLATLVGFVYLMARALKVLPNLTFTAQYYTYRLSDRIKHFSNLATKPFIVINSIGAGLKEIFGRV